jgi:formate dehydrogenase iron-sulfur subunit
VVFSWLRARTLTPLRRTALLMTGDLARSTAWRFIAGTLGGLNVPGVLLLTDSNAAPHSPQMIVAGVTAGLALTFAGEVLERYLFFAAVVAPKMPGAPSA